MLAAEPRRGAAAALLVGAALLIACGGDRAEPTPEVAIGGIAAADPQAIEVGAGILRDGGNAADATVGVALALAVVFPEAGNLGGGGFAVSRFGEDTTYLDFRETAPGAATPDMFRDDRGEAVPERSLVGGLAVGVPGSPAGLWALHRRHGVLDWSRVVEPAVALAREGFRVSFGTARSLRKKRALLERFPAAVRQWMPDGEPLEEGTTVRLPALARTLESYRDHGPEALGNGPAAAAIVSAVREHGGILTAADLAGYAPIWRAPLRFSAFGFEFVGPDLPSSGGILAAETFGLLERVGWIDHPRGSGDRAHLLAEAWRRAYADRFDLGDPSTTEATAADLLTPERLDALAATIDPSRATLSQEIRPEGSALAEAAATTPIVVIDGDGNVVSLTTTLNGLFGSGIWVPEIGFLNNEMDDFTAAPGAPNLYGLVQGEANAVRPGRRMVSSMTPLVARSASGELLAVGGRGGSRIPTGVMQVTLALVVDGLSLEESVRAARIHHQWLPDRLQAEPGALSASLVAELEARGHEVGERPTVGSVHAVRRRADGTFEAMGDPREPGASAVVMSSSAERLQSPTEEPR